MATAQSAANPDVPGGAANPEESHLHLRLTFSTNQGTRKYMEDEYCIATQATGSGDPDDLLYSYLGVFDGHGGGEASTYAREHLLQHIVNQDGFWSDLDSAVLGAIKNGFLSAHYAMWREAGKWPLNHGLPSTAGTTASVVFVRRNKLYIGHVGDSGIVLGYQDDPNGAWKARKLTTDHVPNNPEELARVVGSGGKVSLGSGGSRIMYERPAPGYYGLDRTRRAPTISMPFLSMSRALGDYWSYNSQHRKFVVSPEPDTSVVELDEGTFRCIILGTDGLWNMMTPEQAVARVCSAHMSNSGQLPEDRQLSDEWVNASKMLGDAAFAAWRARGFSADNITVVTAIHVTDLVANPPTPPEPVAPVTDTAPADSTGPGPSARATSGSSTFGPPLTLAMAVSASQVSNGASSSARSQGRRPGPRVVSVSTPPPGTAESASGSAGMSGRGRIDLRSELPGNQGNRKRSINHVEVGPTSAADEGSPKRKSSRHTRPSVRLLESMEYFGSVSIPSSGRSEPKKAKISA